MKGKLITLEGIDCCGKGTQANLLMNYLRGKNIPIHLLHEPGGTLYGEALRAILKYPDDALGAIYKKFVGHSDFPLMKFLDSNRTPQCELFLFEAARAEYANMLKRILASGENVISDRFHDSSTAYQGGGRGISISQIKLLNRIALDGLMPSLTILLDIPIEVMIERVSREDDEKNAYFEKTCDKNFFERVRATYLKLAEEEPERFVVIDGTGPVGLVWLEVANAVNKLLDIKS